MKYVYPAVFVPEDVGGYFISFPDIKMGGTQGKDLIQGIEMAEDFLCLALYHMEEEKSEIPKASNPKDINAGEDAIVTLISADTDEYRRFYENKLVKKTLNIPSWLNAKAEKAGVNFSQLLQASLREHLGIAQS